MSIKKVSKLLAPVFAAGVLTLAAAPLTGCKSDNDDDPEDYSEWKSLNETYLTDVAQKRDAAGNKLFQRVDASFAPGNYTLMRWHNDRSLTAGNLSPMDNSTVKVNYQLRDINGNLVDRGANSVMQPVNTVVGFWNALTNMQVGDTVTAVVPYEAGYGNVTHGNIKPYTTLVFSIRLKEIVGYEIKH